MPYSPEQVQWDYDPNKPGFIGIIGWMIPWRLLFYSKSRLEFGSKNYFPKSFMGLLPSSLGAEQCCETSWILAINEASVVANVFNCKLQYRRHIVESLIHSKRNSVSTHFRASASKTIRQVLYICDIRASLSTIMSTELLNKIAETHLLQWALPQHFLSADNDTDLLIA